MQVCIPIDEDLGLQSAICGHFGSAPCFLVVDTATQGCRAVVNGNQHHGHGQCAPLASLAHEKLDAMIVGGIGMGAVNKLRAAGIEVYYCDRPTVQEALALLAAGSLRVLQPGQVCAGHSHGHP